MMRFIRLAIVAGLPLAAQTNPCAQAGRMGDPAAGASWNGWGPDASNARFQAASAAGISADQVSKLKLKWAFGFPGVKSVLGEPSVAAGRVFLGVDTGAVYSLDAASGCTVWTFQADAGVRSAITVARSAAGTSAYFGDLKANVYSVNASTGAVNWKVRIDDFSSARITGAPKVFEGRVYVPVASGEEGA
jgi:polyvinyl alcohol dehydrogenase (cytochrome)